MTCIPFFTLCIVVCLTVTLESTNAQQHPVPKSVKWVNIVAEQTACRKYIIN